MRRMLLATLVASLFACNSTTVNHGNGGGSGGNGSGGSGGNGSGGSGGTGTGGNGNCASGPNTDTDGDGYTQMQGDCNDCDPNINPGAIDVAGDPTDYDCDGKVDDHSICDTGIVGQKDAPSFAKALDICDPRFLKSATYGGTYNPPPPPFGLPKPVGEWNDPRGRNIVTKFGTGWQPHKGANMVLISSGLAVDESDPSFVGPQGGTQLTPSTLGNLNQADNPLPNLGGGSNCTTPADPQQLVQDYTEITLQMQAPTNANSFSFDFQFFSGEYPKFVCGGYNDQFLAIVKSDSTYPADTNISFDPQMNATTVNSGFFTICTKLNNGNVKMDPPCKTAPSPTNDGTGYEKYFSNANTTNKVPGGSTGWLTTTAPIKPGEKFTLRFVIFDEGDDVLDSAAIIDNFRWGVTKVTGPVTGPITYRAVKHSRFADLTCHV